eukprot:67409-Karenia_brevis.AAC.1
MTTTTMMTMAMATTTPMMMTMTMTMTMRMTMRMTGPKGPVADTYPCDGDGKLSQTFLSSNSGLGFTQHKYTHDIHFLVRLIVVGSRRSVGAK